MSMAKGATATMLVSILKGRVQGGRRTEVEHNGTGGDLLDGKSSLSLHGADLLRRLLRRGDCISKAVSKWFSKLSSCPSRLITWTERLPIVAGARCSYVHPPNMMAFRLWSKRGET